MIMYIVRYQIHECLPILNCLLVFGPTHLYEHSFSRHGFASDNVFDLARRD